ADPASIAVASPSSTARTRNHRANVRLPEPGGPDNTRTAGFPVVRTCSSEAHSASRTSRCPRTGGGARPSNPRPGGAGATGGGRASSHPTHGRTSIVGASGEGDPEDAAPAAVTGVTRARDRPGSWSNASRSSVVYSGLRTPTAGSTSAPPTDL